MAEETKQSVRIQTSLLNPYEKVALKWLAERMPRFVTSDQLTGIGLLGAVFIALGYFLCVFSPAWLWLSSFGYVVNWFGDSLDGTLARVRQHQRPIYGFYIDHNLDCVCEFLMVGGAGLLPWVNAWSALMIVIPYLMMEVYVMINAHLKGVFNLTYSKLGPTELRVILILVNTCMFLFPMTREAVWQGKMPLYDKPMTLYFMDFGCLTIAAIIGIIYICSIVKDARSYAKMDPLKKD